MKKLICILLISWLPLLMAAANAMSMQMAFANQQHLSQVASMDATSVVPCHQYHHKQASQHQSHSCSMCGFCVISSNVANYHADTVFHAELFSSAEPLFLETTFHTQSYPPAIKPPILN